MPCTLIYEQMARLGIHFPESPGIDEYWNEYKVEQWGMCVRALMTMVQLPPARPSAELCRVRPNKAGWWWWWWGDEITM